MRHILAVLGIILVGSAWAEVRVAPGTDATVRERMTPFGKVCKAGDACAQKAEASTGGVARSGKAIYDSSCFICHAAGIGGAPKFQNVEEWAPRIAKGQDALWESTINGLNAMPARGTCMDCSDDELRAGMDYILDAAR